MARIAFVVADDYEDVELTDPYDHLSAEGHVCEVIGTDAGKVTGKRGGSTTVDRTVHDADPTAYDALVIPGGYSPDRLRTDAAMVAFVRRMHERSVPVAAICHAPSLLIEAEVVEGRRLTSYPSIRTDLRNAGADVRDEEVVVDGNLITSRDPGDIPAFIAAVTVALNH